jgi:uncharacterized protein (DUF1800 family)
MLAFNLIRLAGLMGLCAISLAAAPAHAASPPKGAAARTLIQHLLRRFAFSAAPATVTTVQNGGITAWLAQQDDWQALDDSNSELEQLPTQLSPSGGFIDPFVWERMVMQHMVLTPRQLQAKLELHWLDHFAVSMQKIGDPAVMYHYDQTIRANALGNFTTLLTQVAQEAAMLEWLDNNGNVGPVANENFARESMQLYAMGLYKLGMDGSPVIGKNGQPAANYTQKDVQAIALAMTGYGVVYNFDDNNPETRFSVQYFPANHYNQPLKFLGSVRNVPADGTAIAYTMNIISKRPAVAPFEAKELLQRFVTENPSPKYIADIAAVWRAQQDAPDQIAQVVTAIVNHPDFAKSYRSMAKQPAELIVDSLRAMPGMMQQSQSAGPGNSILWELHYLDQQLFYPETVFSFYRPGNLNSLTAASTVLARTGDFSNETSSVQSGANTDTWIDIPTLRSLIGSTSRQAISAYLLDALLDGGSKQEAAILNTYLGDTPSDARLQSAVWLLLNSPDFSVN